MQLPGSGSGKDPVGSTLRHSLRRCGLGFIRVASRLLGYGANLAPKVASRLPHVVIGLHRVPATGRRAEGLREPKVHVRAHACGAIEHTRQRYARHTQPLGRLSDADLGKPLAQDFSYIPIGRFSRDPRESHSSCSRDSFDRRGPFRGQCSEALNGRLPSVLSLCAARRFCGGSDDAGKEPGAGGAPIDGLEGDH